MEPYLALGGGIGSTILLHRNLKVIRAGDLEVVFVDHGGDLPETREHIKRIQEEWDFDVTTLTPPSLYDHCWKFQCVPSIHWRWCTDRFKIQPMKKYTGKATPIIGLSFDERWRKPDFKAGIYPLIDEEMSRYRIGKEYEKKEIVKPCKSGCYFCPFQGKEQWRQLYFNHPDLFLKAMHLENRARERNPRTWLHEKTLRVLSRELKEQTQLALSTRSSGE